MSHSRGQKQSEYLKNTKDAKTEQEAETLKDNSWHSINAFKSTMQFMDRGLLGGDGACFLRGWKDRRRRKRGRLQQRSPLVGGLWFISRPMSLLSDSTLCSWPIVFGTKSEGKERAGGESGEAEGESCESEARAIRGIV